MDKADAISSASDGYGNAAVPAGQWRSSSGSTFHIHGVTDPTDMVVDHPLAD